MKFRRALGFLAISLATVMLTTGCIKLDMDLTVQKDDTVSGELLFAIAKSLAEATEEGGDATASTREIIPGAEDVRIEPYDDGEFVGSKYFFENVPLEQFQPEFEEDKSAISIVRDGDNLIVSGSLDSSTPDQEVEDNPFGSAILEGFAATASIKISMTFPGEIKETNGKVSDQTISWVGEFGKKLDLNALVYAPLTPTIDWILIGILAAVVLAVAGAVLLVLWMSRRRKDKPEESNESLPAKETFIDSSLKLSLAEKMLIRPWYQQKRFAIPLIILVLTALVYWVSVTN